MKVHYKILILACLLFTSCKNQQQKSLKNEDVSLSKQIEKPAVANTNLSIEKFLKDLKNSIKTDNHDDIKSHFYFPLKYTEEILDGLDSRNDVKTYNNYLKFRSDISIFENCIKILKVANSKVKINDSSYEITLDDGSDRMYLDFKIHKKDGKLKITEIYEPENSL